LERGGGSVCGGLEARFCLPRVALQQQDGDAIAWREQLGKVVGGGDARFRLFPSFPSPPGVDSREISAATLGAKHGVAGSRPLFLFLFLFLCPPLLSLSPCDPPTTNAIGVLDKARWPAAS
jgi:hypothetical protein